MIKIIHITVVTLSLILFLSRGTWVYFFNKQLTAKWVKILPHVNDTILLVSGITLAVQTQQYPFVQHWLTVKIICLVGYILLGMVALKWSINTRKGFVAWISAVSLFFFMLSVAMTRHGAGLFY